MTTKAVIVIDGWAGRIRIPCEILHETPAKYRVRLLADCTLRRRYYMIGDTVLVPKHAVVKEQVHA